LRELASAYDHARPYLPVLHATLAKRYARAAAGAVGIAGALAMVALAATTDDEGPTYALLGACLAAIATYTIVRAVLGTRTLASRFVPRFAPPNELVPPLLTGEAQTDLGILARSNPLAALRARLARIEPWSLELPLVAASLLTPLTLHFLAVALFAGPDLRSFATWIRVSLVVVGHAHLALAACAVRYARRLRIEGSSNVHREWGKALAIAVGVAAVPGVILFVVPPALSALTGITFIPIMYLVADAWVSSERVTEIVAFEGASSEEAALRIDVPAPAISAAEDVGIEPARERRSLA
jgi:hypothetical protein